MRCLGANPAPRCRTPFTWAPGGNCRRRVNGDSSRPCSPRRGVRRRTCGGGAPAFGEFFAAWGDFCRDAPFFPPPPQGRNEHGTERRGNARTEMFPGPGGNLPGRNRNTSGAGQGQASRAGTGGLPALSPHCRKMSLGPHVIRDILCYTVLNNVTHDAVIKSADESMMLRHNREKEQRRTPPCGDVLRRDNPPSPWLPLFPRETTPLFRRRRYLTLTACQRLSLSERRA